MTDMEEEYVQRPSSASAPQLPPLSPAQTQPMRQSYTNFKDKAAERQMAAMERRMRAATEAPKRHAFLEGLLNEDLRKISKWHGSRPHHEQKRFVRAVDSLYKGYDQMAGAMPAVKAKAEKESRIAEAQQAALMAEAQAIANRDDPYLRESPRGPPAMGQSASAPNFPSNPIDVFEQNKRRGRRPRGGASGAGSNASVTSSEANNTLGKWMDAQSTTSQSTGASSMTEGTNFSQLTRTSTNCSDCSEPGTHNNMIFRIHKRALAANKRTFNAKDQHAPAYLKDGVPNIGFPECERMQTAYRDQFGHKPLGADVVPREAYSSVFQNQSLPFVDEFLGVAPKDQQKQVAGMVRSLNYLRLAHHRNTSCVMRQEMDLAENSRLWKPKKTEQVFRPEQRNLSRVPLGAIGLAAFDRVKEETPPPSHSGDSVYSPSVSGLGSLPLTPRSLPTPLVGGRDLPMMTEPWPGLLPPIAEGSM